MIARIIDDSRSLWDEWRSVSHCSINWWAFLLYCSGGLSNIIKNNRLYIKAVRQGCPLYLVLFNVFLERIMQKNLTPQWQRMTSLEIIQKKKQKLTSHCRQCPLEDGRSATCGLLMISIFWEAVKKICNNSLWRAGKQLLDRAWRSALTEAKSPSTHQANVIRQNIDDWKSIRRSGSIQILGILTNQDWNIIRGGNNQTVAGTFSHLCGCESRTLAADLERRIPALENKCYRRMIVNCQPSQVIMVQPCLSSS